MRFTLMQYLKASDSLDAASRQLVPDGRCCAICGDSGHQAFECGRNPLVAMQMCEMVTKRAHELHEAIHASMNSMPAALDALKRGGGVDAVESWVDAGAELFETVHEFLHFLAGFNVHLGIQVGPARVVMPTGSETGIPITNGTRWRPWEKESP